MEEVAIETTAVRGAGPSRPQQNQPVQIQAPESSEEQYCDSVYLHTLYYDLEAAANMRTNCPSSRSPAGRTPMETVVQRGEQVNGFKETAGNKSKNPAQTNQTVRAVLANPNIKYHQLTPNIAAALGRMVDMVDAQNQDNSKAAFEIFNGVLRDASFNLGTANFNVLGLSLFRALNPNNSFVSTRQAADLTRHYIVENNAGDALPVLNDLGAMFNSPDFRPAMINPTNVKSWGNLSSGFFHMSNLLQKGLLPRDSLKLFDEGLAMANSIGGSDNSPEIALNYAYALGTIGKDKTIDLHRKTGMTFFARYTPDVLEEFHANLETEQTKGKSPLIVSFPMSDINGAFYAAGHELDPLSRYYGLFIFERSEDEALYNDIIGTSKKQGPLSGMIAGGHGDGDSVRMGEGKLKGGWNTRNTPEIKSHLIDISDKSRWEGMKPLFIQAPTFVFLSCSAGQSEHGIEGMFSEVWPSGKMFAPTEDTSSSSFILGWNGAIKGIKYDVPTRKMVGGKTVIETEKPFWMFW
ncbi:MAG: hypothetical protein PHG97_02585 [Candidatus Margulisbacteria bacterium]|nr:hypothetical protein [Candidatus Margulisiibacteriota bacterium]